MKELRIDAELNLYKESASLAETPRTLRCLVCFLKKQILPSVIFVRDHGFRRGQALSCLIAVRRALRPFDELRAGNFRVQSETSILTHPVFRVSVGNGLCPVPRIGTVADPYKDQIRPDRRGRRSLQEN